MPANAGLCGYLCDQAEDAVKACVVLIGLRPPEILLGVPVNNQKLAAR